MSGMLTETMNVTHISHDFQTIESLLYMVKNDTVIYTSYY